MPPQEQIRILEEKVQRLEALIMSLNGVDKFVFQRDLQLLDGRNIQLAKGTGTKIGTEATQKLGLYGVTPVVQASAISTPVIGTVSGSGDDATINSALSSLKSKIDDIRTALSNLGITA